MVEGSQPTHRTTNLYEYLQVSPRAEAGVIQAAYRALARRYHPDVSTSVNGARAMREINAAYHVLSDPGRRARYDAHRARTNRRSATRRSVTASAPLIDSFRSPRIGVGRANGARRPSGSPRARPILAAVTVTLLLVGALGLAMILLVNAFDDGTTAGSLPTYEVQIATQPVLVWPLDRLAQSEIGVRR